MKDQEYSGGYTVIDQTWHPHGNQTECKVLGHYPTLKQAAQRCKASHSAIILRSKGLRYDISESESVSKLIQKCGVLSTGMTFIWPA